MQRSSALLSQLGPSLFPAVQASSEALSFGESCGGISHSLFPGNHLHVSPVSLYFPIGTISLDRGNTVDNPAFLTQNVNFTHCLITSDLYSQHGSLLSLRLQGAI